MKIGVIIIGLGQIAIGYDQITPQLPPNNFDSLSTAFSHNPNFELVAGVDPDQSARRRFSELLDIPTFSCLEEIPKRLVDLSTAFVVSAPTPEHSSILYSIVKTKNDPWILCEKPMGSSLFELDALEQVVDTSKILVNYSRRFSPDISLCEDEFKRMIKQSKNVTPLVKCEVYGGYLRTGSHFIDLCCYWFGASSEKIAEKNFLKPSTDGPILGFDTVDVLYLDVDSGSSESYATLSLESGENLISLSRGELTIKHGSNNKIMNIVVNQADTVEAFHEMIISGGTKNRSTFQDARRVHQIIDSLQSYR